MSAVSKVILTLIVVFILVVVSTGIFIGSGYLISTTLPLTLFEASLLCIGASFVCAFIIFVVIMGFYMGLKHEEQRYCYEEEDEEDETPKKFDQKLPIINNDKVGRNDPCPCESGKKYKYCCGKKS